jgi:hypothetical protein|tara:strand:+ start:1395 stop:1598 length:204 start_codon:yes stop_codon:yes gene_type:complete
MSEDAKKNIPYPRVPFEKHKEQLYRNVALFPEDHALLKKIAQKDQRTMTRQLSVIVRKWNATYDNFS